MNHNLNYFTACLCSAAFFHISDFALWFSIPMIIFWLINAVLVWRLKIDE